MKILKHQLAILGFAIVLSSCNGDSNQNDSGENSENNKDTTSTATELEEEPTEKEIFLRTLIGEHPLTAVSGFMGANTMVDFFLEDGQWTGVGSSISAGEREGYEWELNADDISKLKSAKIVVTEDLSVYYSCLGKKYFNAPFNASGMTYLLHNKPEDFISTIPKELTENTTYLKEDLYLYAEDEIDETIMEPIDIVEVYADAVMIVCKADGTFEMSLFYGECCDNSTYIFK